MNSAAEAENTSDTLRAIEDGLQDIKGGRVISFEYFLKKHRYEV